ncbi:MAG: hypothetical protein KBA26_09885 [Candidatus Delongbacteria bacterium]|nr:hypothetical protein [Candidatus Delongbacteria bacterium]
MIRDLFLIIGVMIVILSLTTCSDNSSDDDTIIVTTIDGFKDSVQWEAFNVSREGGFMSAGGYYGAADDGKYIYFAPCRDINGFHGQVLRYDTDADFKTITSFEVYDAGGIENLNTKGYAGAVYAKNYVYFVPYINDDGRHANVLRYNTNGEFKDQSSWSAFDAASTEGIPSGFMSLGYDGAVYDDHRYIYFVPYGDQNGANPYALRYDTEGDFKDKSSWKAVNTMVVAENTNAKGYYGCAYDGKYIYYVPFANQSGAKFHAMMMRYNTSLPFENKSSWDCYDAGNTNSESTVGYKGAVYDGRYVYYVPFRDKEGIGGQHTRVLRYDTELSFSNEIGWNCYDASYTDSLNTIGYVGALYDGHYVYFVPYQQDELFHANVLRYDTRKSFKENESWSAFDSKDVNGLNAQGYKYGIVMKDYLYFVPYNNNHNFSGIVLRYKYEKQP